MILSENRFALFRIRRLSSPGRLRVLHVHMLNGPVERGDLLEAAPPVLQVPARPEHARLAVATADRVDEMAVCCDEARAAFGDAGHDHLGGRIKQLRRRLARELKHAVLRGLCGSGGDVDASP